MSVPDFVRPDQSGEMIFDYNPHWAQPDSWMYYAGDPLARFKVYAVIAQATGTWMVYFVDWTEV